MIKSILKSVFKNKIVSIFLIIEFTFTIFFSLQSIETYKILYSKRDIISSIIDTKNTLVVREKDPGDNYKKYLDVLDNLKSLKEIKKVGYYRCEDAKTTFNDTLFGVNKYIFINEDMLSILKLKDKSGDKISANILKKSISENEAIPAILGADLKAEGKNFDFTSHEWKKTYKSVITLKEGAKFPDEHYIENNPIDLKKAIIIEFQEDNPEAEVKANAAGHFSFIKFQSSDVEKLKRKIYNRFKEKGMNVIVDTMTNNINDYIKEENGYFISQLRITICLGIFSIIGTAVTLILSVNRRKKEFGIRMSTGASKFYLLKLLYGEVILLMIISYLCALAIYASEYKRVLIDMKLNVFQLFDPVFSLLFLLCAFALILLASITVVITILKMQPRELIGGAK